jgi:cytoskeletal protein CcmA (bactofilin family)
MGQYFDTSSLNFNFIGKESLIEGKLTLSGVVRVAGKLEGEIHLLPDSLLIIEQSGEIKGRLFCHAIEIYGKFSGELHSQNNLTIYPTAFIIGKIQSQNMTIHPGASVEIEGHTTL